MSQEQDVEWDKLVDTDSDSEEQKIVNSKSEEAPTNQVQLRPVRTDQQWRHQQRDNQYNTGFKQRLIEEIDSRKEKTVVVNLSKLNDSMTKEKLEQQLSKEEYKYQEIFFNPKFGYANITFTDPEKAKDFIMKVPQFLDEGKYFMRIREPRQENREQTQRQPHDHRNQQRFNNRNNNYQQRQPNNYNYSSNRPQFPHGYQNFGQNSSQNQFANQEPRTQQTYKIQKAISEPVQKIQIDEKDTSVNKDIKEKITNLLKQNQVQPVQKQNPFGNAQPVDTYQKQEEILSRQNKTVEAKDLPGEPNKSVKDEPSSDQARVLNQGEQAPSNKSPEEPMQELTTTAQSTEVAQTKERDPIPENQNQLTEPANPKQAEEIDTAAKDVDQVDYHNQQDVNEQSPYKIKTRQKGDDSQNYTAQYPKNRGAKQYRSKRHQHTKYEYNQDNYASHQQEDAYEREYKKSLDKNEDYEKEMYDQERQVEPEKQSKRYYQEARDDYYQGDRRNRQFQPSRRKKDQQAEYVQQYVKKDPYKQDRSEQQEHYQVKKSQNKQDKNKQTQEKPQKQQTDKPYGSSKNTQTSKQPKKRETVNLFDPLQDNHD